LEREAASVGGLFVSIILISKNLLVEFKLSNQALTPITPLTISRKLASFAKMPFVSSRSPVGAFDCWRPTSGKLSHC
jgi:hypothetical protein